MNIFQLSCASVSILLNIFLCYLIISRSPKNLGLYKYIMCYISVFEAIYSFWDFLTEPMVHSYGSAFVVFRYFKDTPFDREISFYLICLYCGFFAFSLAIFGVHFIYRYGALNKGFMDRYLPGKRVYVLFVIPIWYCLWWAILCVIYYRYTDQTDNYMNGWEQNVLTFLSETIKHNYGMEISEVSYICVFFQPPDENGVLHPDPRIFGAIACMWFMIISSMYSVFYFGFRCYFNISKAIGQNTTVSAATRSLQKQLFHALVVQTFIPLVLMYIPIGILFFFPMINFRLFFNTNFVAYTIALYPAIDPLPNMLIIKSYRNAIIEIILFLLGKRKTSRVSQISNEMTSRSH